MGKKFHTTVYPRSTLYWAQLQSILKVQNRSHIDWYNEMVESYVDNTSPLGTAITDYVRKHIQKPPTPGEKRDNSIRKLRNMTKEQLNMYRDNILKMQGLVDGILDEKVRFEDG